MSVDILMYKVNKLTGDDMNVLRGQHIDNLDSLCNDDNWEYKAYSQDEIEKDPNRFSEILKYAKPIGMRRTITDYRQCYIDHGMPEDTKSYCCSWHPNGVTLKFDDKAIYIDEDTLERYSHEEDCTYYVYRRKYIDIDVSNWFARTIMGCLEKEYDCDLSYHPHYLTKKTADIISKTLVKNYEDGEMYIGSEMTDFIMELLRALTAPEKRMFIEFQD